MRTVIAVLAGCIFLHTMSTTVSAKSPFKWLRDLVHRVQVLEEHVDASDNVIDDHEERITILEQQIPQVPPDERTLVVVDANDG